MIRESRFETPVGGLICPSCEDNIRDELMYRKGILSVTASYIKGRVLITYDPDVISEDRIKEILSLSGYPVTDKARCGIIYDAVTVLSAFLVMALLKVIPLPGIPSLSRDGGNIYLNVFLIGLVTGTHCIVMCGGIMISAVGKERGGKRLLYITLYNLSRILTSAVLGALFASIGSAIVFSDKTKSMIYVFCSIYILFSALSLWGVPGIRAVEAALPHFPLPRRINAGPLILGIFTAVMPCSSSSTMWMTAMTLSSPLDGALMMALWALGTFPLMLLFGMVSSPRRGRHPGLTTRLNIVLLLSLGMRLFLMGIK